MVDSRAAPRSPSGGPIDLLAVLGDAELGVVNDIRHIWWQIAVNFAGYTSIWQPSFTLVAEELESVFFTATIWGMASTVAPCTRAVVVWEFNGVEVVANRCPYADQAAARVCRLGSNALIIPGVNAPAAVAGANTVRLAMIADPVAASSFDARSTAARVIKWLGKPSLDAQVVS